MSDKPESTEAPTVGRTVHYVAYGTPGGEFLPEHRAAIVTEVGYHTLGEPGHDVSLCVLNPSGIFFNTAKFDPDCAGGTWHWPERG